MDDLTQQTVWIHFHFSNQNLTFSSGQQREVKGFLPIDPPANYHTNVWNQKSCRKIKVPPPLLLQPPRAPPAGNPPSFWWCWKDLYFLKARDSRISIMTFPCIKCEIHKYKVLKRPNMCFILKSMGFNIKYDIPVYQM